MLPAMDGASLQRTCSSDSRTPRARTRYFARYDGANCPSADVSTLAAETSAYSQLLNYGLIRMTLPVPANAEFSIIAISDPYQCPETTATLPALYRRPLPATNLKFLNGIMWDGREPDLKTQAKDATLVHTEPTGPPTDAQLTQIVSLETSLFTAQSQDNLAGDLTAQGANGGPEFLSTLPFSPGMNSGTRHLTLTSSPYTPAGPPPPAATPRRNSRWRAEKCCSILFPLRFPACTGI